MNPQGALSYLIGTLIDLYTSAVLLRLLLQWVRADFYNPVVQFLVTVTNPPLLRLRRFIPSIGRLDTASLVLAMLLQTAGVWLVTRLTPTGMSWAHILVFAGQKLIMTVLLLYFFLVIVAVILSWVGARFRHPVVPVVFQLTEPVLRPVRKVIPPIGGFDLSPVFVLIGIRFLLLLLGW